MDSSKFDEGTGECSGSESRWTWYIVSPDHDDNEDNEDRSTGDQQGYKKGVVDVAEDVDSDDSMASDASSGPSDQGQIDRHVGRNQSFRHADKKDERKHVSKKHNQQEEKKHHHEQRKAEKDEPVNRANSAGRSKKM